MTEMESMIEKLLDAQATLDQYQSEILTKTDEAQHLIDQVNDEYQPVIDSLERAIKELREIIRDLMLETGDEKKRHAGKVVTLVRRPKLSVVDMTAAREWLTEQGQLAAFITLNNEKYIKAYPDGPGIGKRFTTFITVQEDRVT